MDINRRDLLKAGVGLTAMSFLPGCGLGGGGEGTGTPGILRVGALGQPSDIMRDPHERIPNDSDFMIMSLVYDTLTTPAADPNVAPRLASKWAADSSLQKWRFTMSPDAKFHDGSPVTAEDTAWSLRRLFKIGGTSRVPVRSGDDIYAESGELVIVTPEPNRLLPVLMRINSFTVKKGTTDFEEGAIGSGPFKLESFENGNARLTRNPDWHLHKPSLEAIQITRFDDVSALLNAVLSGQIDLASNVGPIAARSAKDRGNLTVVRRPDNSTISIVTHTSKGPFTDVRVRQAMRLATDREALVQQVYSGFGKVGNDILGTADPAYAASIPQRARDVDEAKALLSAAGLDTSQRYPLLTKQDYPGEIEAAKAFAVQMRDIGLNIDVVVQEDNVFYERSWAKAPLYTNGRETMDSALFLAKNYMVSSAEDNETGFRDAEFDKAVARALRAEDEAEFVEAARAVQQIEYDRGGYIVWGIADGIDIAGPGVKNLPKLGGTGRLQLWNASKS